MPAFLREEESLDMDFPLPLLRRGRPLKGSGQEQNLPPRRKSTFFPRCFLPHPWEPAPAINQLIFDSDSLPCPIHVSQQHFTISAVSLVLVSAFTAPVTHQV